MTNDFTKMFADLPNAFAVDPKAFEDGFKTVASYNERMTGAMLTAAQSATDVNTKSTKETIDNMRELTAVRSEPTEYAHAMTTFMQKQFEVAQRQAEALSNIAQAMGNEVGDMTQKAGEKAAANANDAAKTATKTKAA